MLTLPQYSSAETEALNDLFIRNGQFQIDFLNTEFTIRFLDQPIFFTSQIVCEILVDQHKYTLALSDFFFKDYLEEKFPEVKLTTLPAILKRPLFEVFFEDHISKFEEWSNAQVSITDWSLKPKSYPTKKGASIELPFMMGDQILGAISCDMAAFLQLKEWYKIYPPLQSPFPQLSATPMVILGETNLEMAQFKTLGLNDVILIDRTTGLSFNTAHLYFSSSFAFEGEIKDNVFIINHYLDQEMTDDLQNEELDDAFDISLDDELENLPEVKTPKKTKAKASSSGSMDTDKLPIHLKLSLTSLKVPLNEIQSLAPGYIFDLKQPLSGPIDIHANGQQIGTGELVQVEDRIGVKVTKLYR